MSASLNDLIPEFAPIAREFVDLCGSSGLFPRVTSTLRTHSQQQRLYAEYLRGGRGYPVAPPGTSAHEFGYAFDMVLSPMDALWDAGQYWLSLGGKWGPGDAVHFEYPGFSPNTARAADTDTVGSLLDTALGFAPGIGGAESVFQLASELFSENEMLDLIAHPSKAVKRYPWLIYLGPPFVFYAK